jgi:hypothetical protein
MPRLKAVKTKEEAANVPKDKPLTVEFPPEGEVDIGENPFEENDQKADGSRAAGHDQSLHVDKKDDRRQALRDDGSEGQEEDVSDLKRQLEDMRRAQTEGERRLQVEIRARQEAERAREQREHESFNYRLRAEDAEYDAILNAIQAAQSEGERAQHDIAFASEAGNHQAVAEANRRLARAEGRLAQLEDGKAAIEDQKSREAARYKAQKDQQQTQPQQPQRQLSVEEYIDQIPNLLQSQKDWLKSHPETMTDNRINMRLQAAHIEAEDMKYRPGTKQYFKHIEQRLGFAEPDEEDEEVTKTPVAAPPSKNATSPSTGRPTSTKITLTPEQREMAALSGVDELTYAKNLVKMQQAKRDGLIN